MGNLKRILIVDDSEIDRAILRNMLSEEFQVVEADNGYTAFDVIMKMGEKYFDAVLLDISMPLFDGISVLRVLRENNLQDIPVFMVTAEATKENIEKASRYNITEFIKKPFDREDVIKRVRDKLGLTKKVGFTKEEIDETRKYISDLEYIYNHYLSLFGRDKGVDARRSYCMKVLLEKARTLKMEAPTEPFMVELLCKAAYLCNIGQMFLPNISSAIKPVDGDKDFETYQQHTILGADLVRLNYSQDCRQFVELCAEICLHHHERFDGKGFPHGIGGHDISVYAQMCGLLERLEELFFYYGKHSAARFDRVINQLKDDFGFSSNNVLFLLIESKDEIIRYYS